MLKGMNRTLQYLKELIREEVGSLVYLKSAGFGGSAGIAGRGRGSGELPPLGLGDEEQQEEEIYGKEQKKSQFAVRVDDRRNRKTRQD
jgi:hypothetical protein